MSIGFEFFFFFSSRRRHTRSTRDWSSDVCSSDLAATAWLGSLYYILTATQLRAAEVGIRDASVAGILILAMLNLLRLSLGRQQTWRAILGQRSEERRVGKECRSRWSP